MMTTKITFNILLLWTVTTLPLTAFSQSFPAKEIAEKIIPLRSPMSDLNYWDHFLNDIGSARIIALGEASHGTHEFFSEKAKIVRNLIISGEYRTLGIEWDRATISRINAILQTESGNIKPLMKELYLYNTEEILKLFEWIKQFNEKRPEGDKVTVYGFDDFLFHQDVLHRDQWMFETLLEQFDSLGLQKTILWAHNVHILKDTLSTGAKGLGYFLKTKFGDDYYALGFDSYRGIVHTIKEGGIHLHEFTAGPSTFSASLARLDNTGAFVPFKENRQMTTPPRLTILNVGSTWSESHSLDISPGKDLDALLFIRETSPSHILDEE